MSYISNAIGDQGQSGRIDEIKAAYAADEISKSEYDELIEDESLTSKYLNLKKVAMIALVLTVGFLTIM